jgi:hypothetical protein
MARRIDNQNSQYGSFSHLTTRAKKAQMDREAQGRIESENASLCT